MIHSFDSLSLYVGNAYQAAHFYRTMFGFTPQARRAQVVAADQMGSIVLSRGGVSMTLTCALAPDGHAGKSVALHGDTVHDVAFAVDDVEGTLADARARGAHVIDDASGDASAKGARVRRGIAGPGDLVHSFVERDPSKDAAPSHRGGGSSSLDADFVGIDHVAIAVEAGHLNEWVDYYCQGLGFEVSHEEDILTDFSGMNSKAVCLPGSSVQIVLMEPAKGRRHSQIQDYLTCHRGPGVQHAAILTRDIGRSVSALRSVGVEFLRTPRAYYDALSERIGAPPETALRLREFGILVDRDPSGHLMQIFTLPVQDRPTFFWELIQRDGARGFGTGNIRALFDALEREQAARATGTNGDRPEPGARHPGDGGPPPVEGGCG